MSLYAKRRPYPYHLIVNGVGFMLGSPGPNRPALVSSKTQDIAAVAPPDYSYAGTNPISEREEPYESLVLGMGFDLQEKWQDRRYQSARAVDLSVWPWCKGPEITLLTPAVKDDIVGVTEFFELGSTLYAANGRFVLRRDSDAGWSVAKDFGGGEAILDVQVFTSNFDGVQRAFFALKTGVAQWTSNGTAYTPMATFHALAFAVVGREFWWADDTNRMRKLDTNADPTVEGNYTSLIFNVGDKSSPITSLMITAGGVLVIAKTDGLYTLDGAGDDHELFPFLRYADSATNGKVWGQFENNLYVAYSNSLGKLDPQLGWASVGPDTLIDNTSEVRGRVSAFAGVETMFAWAALFDADSLTGWLCKLGAWSSQENQLDAVHLDAWHGSLSVPFTGRAIQTLFVSGVGAPARHTRTYLGFSDGTVGWLINSCTPNPTACEHYRYHTGDGYVDLPVWHGLFPVSEKSVRHATVTGPLLNATNYVTLEYQMNPTDPRSWTALAERFDSALFEQLELPTTTHCVQAAFRVHLVNTVATETPLVSAFSVGHALRPPRVMQFEADILCADGLVRRDGVPIRMGRQQIRAFIEAAVDDPGAASCVLPDETAQRLSFTDYSVRQAFDEVGRQWRGSLRIKAVQWSPETA